MKELSVEEKAKAYDEALKVLHKYDGAHIMFTQDLKEEMFPELREEYEDERMVKFIKNQLFNIKKTITDNYKLDTELTEAIDWLEKQGEHANFRNKIQIDDKVTRNEDGVLVNLSQLKRVAKKDEKQGEQKELNLVEILKHYPKETELYSPLYGKLWLAEVDEECGIITCYKHSLDKGCKRAILKQEDTVSFYANGTTGLPDCNVSDNCMLFLYDSEKQGKQGSAWSEEDDIIAHDIDYALRCQITYSISRLQSMSAWILNLKNRIQPQSQWKPSEEQMSALRYVTNFDYGGHKATLVSLYEQLKKLREE